VSDIHNLSDYAHGDRLTVPFEDYVPTILEAELALSTKAFKHWWKTWGSEQEPSHSWTRACCRQIAALVGEGPELDRRYWQSYRIRTPSDPL